jgi:hypothetical protein
MSYENEDSRDTEKGDGETYFCLFGQGRERIFQM